MEKQVYGIHGLRIVRNTWSYYTRKKKRRGITWDSDASHFLQWRREVRSQDNLILFHYASSYPHCIPTQFAGSKTMFPYNSHPQKIRKVWFIPVLVGCFHFYLFFWGLYTLQIIPRFMSISSAPEEDLGVADTVPGTNPTPFSARMLKLGLCHWFGAWLLAYNILQCEAPKIAKLVPITPITMVYGTYNYSYWGL
jgi:hypothetical protein